MAHFAKINIDSIVEQVIVVNNEIILKADGTESELKGKRFLNSIFGSANWAQTFYNGSIRKNYAGIGYFYDSTRDAFITPKPYNSWILNEQTCVWDSPIDYPNDGKMYKWNEEIINWEEVIKE
tara:strand:+ start:106 stop:474 length:369 start_codon:yes stop_codon:yes gene_type:complete